MTRNGSISPTWRSQPQSLLCIDITEYRPAIRAPCQRPDRELAGAVCRAVIEMAAEPPFAIFLKDPRLARTYQRTVSFGDQRAAAVEHFPAVLVDIRPSDFISSANARVVPAVHASAAIAKACKQIIVLIVTIQIGPLNRA